MGDYPAQNIENEKPKTKKILLNQKRKITKKFGESIAAIFQMKKK